MIKLFSLSNFLFFSLVTFGQENINLNKFRQLKQELATPNVYRTASGAPGHEYYQQKADYKIAVTLDDKNQSISGEETITYHNNSPDALSYLWLQLDQNVRAKDSDTYKIQRKDVGKREAFSYIEELSPGFDGGFKLDYVKDTNNKDLDYIVVKTMMRIDLPSVLEPGESFSFKIKYSFNIQDRMTMGGRSGYEYFKETDNYLYTIAQFFPRMCVYNDVEGWQNKQFLGRGEFALTFGDYEVDITVPSDHVVSATGELQNADEVLTEQQVDRLEKAKKADKPVLIVTQEEAEKNEKKKASGSKTWRFKAENVRDFAFASSRQFIWDAMGVPMGDRTVMAMSFYPKEGNPLWGQYSTEVVAHTLRSYSDKTFEYPYPVAQSINGEDIGMEYPMICFNWGRCEEDGTYSRHTKYSMISVIIHEVGHNYFPMIVNSDERQWTWMDEGLNSFLEFLAQVEWEKDNYYARRGHPKDIARYMAGDKSKLVPIMSNSESIYQFGNNAYGKPAVGLNILRETILGRELFDFAFKTYSQRWMFKHPTPADFFRTMEDASGVDLDWFWRGWFYTTDHTDISLDKVKWFQIDSRDPNKEEAYQKELRAIKDVSITSIRNEADSKPDMETAHPRLRDFYSSYDKLTPSKLDYKEHHDYMATLTEAEKAILHSKKQLYELTFTNKGGLVMPLILLFEFNDGSEEEIRIPAEIWKMNESTITKVFAFDKEVKSISLDPYQETADTDMENNFWPPRNLPSKFELFIERKSTKENEMQKDKRAKELKD